MEKVRCVEVSNSGNMVVFERGERTCRWQVMKTEGERWLGGWFVEEAFRLNSMVVLPSLLDLAKSSFSSHRLPSSSFARSNESILELRHWAMTFFCLLPTPPSYLSVSHPSASVSR